MQGKRCLVSGSGNVAQYAAEKLLQLGAVVLTMSDSTGYIFEPNGFTMEQVQQVGEGDRGSAGDSSFYAKPSSQKQCRHGSGQGQQQVPFWNRGCPASVCRCITLLSCVLKRLEAGGSLLSVDAVGVLLQVMHIKNVERTTLAAYKSPTGKYVPKERCWNADCKADVALPCATQVGSRGSSTLQTTSVCGLPQRGQYHPWHAGPCVWADDWFGSMGQLDC